MQTIRKPYPDALSDSECSNVLDYIDNMLNAQASVLESILPAKQDLEAKEQFVQNALLFSLQGELDIPQPVGSRCFPEVPEHDWNSILGSRCG